MGALDTMEAKGIAVGFTDASEKLGVGAADAAASTTGDDETLGAVVVDDTTPEEGWRGFGMWRAATWKFWAVTKTGILATVAKTDTNSFMMYRIQGACWLQTYVDELGVRCWSSVKHATTPSANSIPVAKLTPFSLPRSHTTPQERVIYRIYLAPKDMSHAIDKSCTSGLESDLLLFHLGLLKVDLLLVVAVVFLVIGIPLIPTSAKEIVNGFRENFIPNE